MDDRDEFEETVDQYRSGTPSTPSGSREPYTGERPPVLRPDVVSRPDLDSPFDALTKGFPDVIQKAKGFYARHPTLVKALGTVAVAAIARRLFRGRPGLL
jgi:hypothetical protein